MITFDTSDAHSPWTNLGEVLGQVSQAPSASFNAAFLRVCKIRDELMAFAEEPNAPLDDRIVAARRFDPHQYTEIFPFDPKQWREKNCDRYEEYRGRLDDWIKAEEAGPERGPAAELELFAEHLDLLALHYQLGKEVISRQKLIDKVFGSYTRLRRAANRLPKVVGWSRRLTNTLNETVVHYQDATRSYEKARTEFRWYAAIILLVVLGVILALGLMQWQGIALTQEALRTEIRQGIADTREDAKRAVTKAENVASRFAALRQRFDEVEQGQRIATMENQLAEVKQEITRLAKAVEKYPEAIRKFGEQVVVLEQRVEGLEGTVGKQVAIKESLPSAPISPAVVLSSPISGEVTSPRPTVMPTTPVIPYEPEPVQPRLESESSPSILDRLAAMETKQQQSDARQDARQRQSDARQEKLEEALRWTEQGFARIKESATDLRDALRGQHNAR